MSTYLGIQDLNAVLRGETKAVKGDTMLTEDANGDMWASFRYMPRGTPPPKAHMHFEVLATGTRETCEAVAKRGATR